MILALKTEASDSREPTSAIPTETIREGREGREGRYACNQIGCRYITDRTYDLRKHIMIHTGEKPYVCKWEGCTAAFITRSGLTVHTRVHSIYRPLKSNLKRKANAMVDVSVEIPGGKLILAATPKKSNNITSIKERRTYTCTYDKCGYVTGKKDSFNKHRMIHTGERPFKCMYEGCSAAFIQSSQLSSHVPMHTGVRPYSCTYEGCRGAFIHLSYLKKHMRIHTGEKPFICTWEGCTSAFIDSNHLKRHYRKHTGITTLKDG